MMGHSVPLPHQTGPVAASWLVSCLLHAVLALAALFFVRHLQLAPQTEPFQWDVAVVAPLSSSVESAPAVQSTTLPTPAIQPPSPSVTSVSPARQSVEPARTEPPPLPKSASSPDASQEQLLQSKATGSTTTPILSTDSPPTVTPQPLSTPAIEQATLLHDESPTMMDSPPHAESPLNPSSRTIASITPADQVKTTKADYGWLAAIMAQWIEDLNKRYPAILRTEGMEGKVTLVAMLHENGRLSGVRVVKSSGHAALDQVAVEDVTNGPPITLTHPLNRTQMPVKFSISYDLKTAR